jgi:integrase/recombinase XerD
MNRMTDKIKRTPVKEKTKELVRLLKDEYPDYSYLRSLFRQLRIEFGIDVMRTQEKLPYVPSEEEMRKYYEVVWRARDMKHVLMVKTLLYTGVRVGEFVNIKLSDVDLDNCQIKISDLSGVKARIVPFPNQFKEILAMHIVEMKKKNGEYLFESSWKKKYTERGIRKVLAQYTKLAGIEESISPQKLRNFLFTWLKKQGIDDSLIQPYSGHESRITLEKYTRLAASEAQKEYNDNIGKFPV